MKLSCFKAYDIRGKLIEQLSEPVAYRIGRAYSEYLSAKKVAVGGDVRLTSESLKLALAAGLIDGGAEVIDLGMTGTEEIYYAAKYLDIDGGIEVTASHNPIDYNGMKLVKRDAQPISGDSGLFAIQELAESYSEQQVEHALSHYCAGKTDDKLFLNGIGSVDVEKLKRTERYTRLSILNEYVGHLLSYVNADNFRPMKLVVNAGNGAAGHVIDAIDLACQRHGIPLDFIKINHAPDGTFPNGIPNPLLPENRQDTADAVIEHGADMGIAWDGDFDRCFLFDETGTFVEGYYIVGMLAEAFLQKSPGEKVIYDPRVFWNTEDLIEQTGGIAVKSKTGHAFIKERMRKENAIYGGEMSAHHYFRDFAYCDSGMIPWLLVAELLCIKQQPLSGLLAGRIKAFPSSGEINRKVEDADVVLNNVLARYESDAVHVDKTDGVGIEFEQWRFNLRKSNTEPVIRLNVESRGDEALMKAKTEEVLTLIK